MCKLLSRWERGDRSTSMTPSHPICFLAGMLGKTQTFPPLVAVQDAMPQPSPFGENAGWFDVGMSEAAVGEKRGASPSHVGQVAKKKGRRGSLAALAAKEDAMPRPSKSNVIPSFTGERCRASLVNHPVSASIIPSSSDVARAAGIVPSLISGNRDYLISSNLFNLVARSIQSHTEGLMDLTTAFQALDRQREELQYQVQRRAEAALAELQSKYDLLQSKYDQLEASSTDAGRQAVAAFQASPEFLEIVTSRMEAQRSEQVRTWMETKEGRLWRDKEVLISFRCGRYDMQK
ncbi:unnamed protein product, partial [Cuscuta epithymum]